MSGKHIRVRLSEEPLDPAGLLAEAGRSDAGAVTLFLGTARDHSAERTGITHLDYDAYAEQVEAKLAEIVDEALERWPLLSVVVEHRVGRVEVGQPSVAVAVSSAHRDTAFEAARYLIDQLKLRVPIWKQENWQGGSVWIEGA